MPLHLQPVFASLGIPEGALPVAEQAAREVMSLPMHPYLTPEDQERVVRVLADVLNQLPPNL
jgi:UDP-2-acetamido-2-deoxy-ribo-hexuluronate aminotransferase